MKFSELALLRWMTHFNIGLTLGLLLWLASLPTSGHAHGVAAGTRPDRLLGASTPVVAKVELHSLKPDANGLRGGQVEAIELPAQTVTRLRHTGDYQPFGALKKRYLAAYFLFTF